MATFNTLYSNTFTGANQNPIDPTNWTVLNSQPLQVLSAECVAVDLADNIGAEFFSGAVDFTKDQWLQFTIAGLAFASSILAALRYNAGTGTSYLITISNPGGAGNVHITLRGPNGALIVEVLNLTITAGDVFFFSAVGSTFTVTHNGSTIISQTDTQADNDGTLFLSLFPNASLTDAAITNFSAGSVTATFSISGNAGVASALVSYSGTSTGSVTADGSGNYTISGLADGNYTITPSLAGYTFSPTSQNETLSGSNVSGVDFTATPGPPTHGWSPVDCRHYATFPNQGILQPDGSVFYIGQTSCNESIPTTDAREAGAPVDSRAETPENSRVDPSTVSPD
jgi:hypothetical protein